MKKSAIESAAKQLLEVLSKPFESEIVEIVLKQPFKAAKFAWITATPFDKQLRKLRGIAKHIATMRLMHPEQVRHDKLKKLSNASATWLEVKRVPAGRHILVLCMQDKLYVAKVR